MAVKLRNAYDLVVWAGPPLGPEPDPLALLAKEADAVLAGLPAEQASGRGAREIRAAVRALPPEALGAVVVGAPEPGA
jgi:hypothetical protein